jgi:ABC-type tungstate transport system substrate-binding protein
MPIIFIYHHYLMRSMKKGIVFVTALLTAAFFGLCIASLNSIIPVIASIERTALESIDLHLEECIKQLHAGYAKNALSHCEISEQELDALLENTTAPTPG